MDAAAYKTFLQGKLERHFDFLDPAKFPLFEADLLAEYKQADERFFFTKRVNLYRVETDETVILRVQRKAPAAEDIERYARQFKQYFAKELRAGPDHMASVVTLVLASEEKIAPRAADAIRKVNIHRDFMFTLRGWADFALIAVDLTGGEVYSNLFGAKSARHYTWK